MPILPSLASTTVITKKLAIAEDAMIPRRVGQGNAATAVADGPGALSVGKKKFSGNPRHANYPRDALLAVYAEAGGAVAYDR